MGLSPNTSAAVAPSGRLRLGEWLLKKVATSYCIELDNRCRFHRYGSVFVLLCDGVDGLWFDSFDLEHVRRQGAVHMC
eukprot:5883627-Amphidinium_carterae.1